MWLSRCVLLLLTPSLGLHLESLTLLTLIASKTSPEFSRAATAVPHAELVLEGAANSE